MKGSDYLKEHKELIGLLGNTSQALRKEALAQTNELTKELMKNPTKKNALALAKRGATNLGKRIKTRGNRVVLRGGNVMGSGIFGDVFEDLAVDGAKKLYKFDKEHGSHLKSGLIGGLKNMVGSIFKGGNGMLDDIANKYQKEQHYPHNRFAVLPDVYEPHPSNPFSGWVEKERRDTGYYGRPAILGEGM